MWSCLSQVKARPASKVFLLGVSSINIIYKRGWIPPTGLNWGSGKGSRRPKGSLWTFAPDVLGWDETKWCPIFVRGGGRSIFLEVQALRLGVSYGRKKGINSRGRGRVCFGLKFDKDLGRWSLGKDAPAWGIPRGWGALKGEMHIRC